jgi:hypothetical protein
MGSILIQAQAHWSERHRLESLLYASLRAEGEAISQFFGQCVNYCEIATVATLPRNDAAVRGGWRNDNFLSLFLDRPLVLTAGVVS